MQCLVIRKARICREHFLVLRAKDFFVVNSISRCKHQLVFRKIFCLVVRKAHACDLGHTARFAFVSKLTARCKTSPVTSTNEKMCIFLLQKSAQPVWRFALSYTVFSY